MSHKKNNAFHNKAIRHFTHVKKGTIFTLLGVLVLLCALLYGVSYKNQPQAPVGDQTTLAVKITTDPAATNGSQPTGTKQKTSATTAPAKTLPAETKGDWKLLLINNSHPLPENFPVSIKKLPNGQAVDERVYPFLERMLEDARADGLKPVVCSSYRTKEDQSDLYGNKVGKYTADGFGEEEAMARAAGWVATPGTSEHQAGLSVDIVDINNQNLNETQETTPVSLWMKEHCTKYGFILRYPTEKNKITGVNYEPWHYRYVGVKAAAEIMEKGITLEEYLNAA